MDSSEDRGLLFLSDWDREQHKKRQMEVEAAFNRLKMADSTSGSATTGPSQHRRNDDEK